MCADWKWIRRFRLRVQIVTAEDGSSGGFPYAAIEVSLPGSVNRDVVLVTRYDVGSGRAALIKKEIPAGKRLFDENESFLYCRFRLQDNYIGDFLDILINSLQGKGKINGFGL